MDRIHIIEKLTRVITHATSLGNKSSKYNEL